MNHKTNSDTMYRENGAAQGGDGRRYYVDYASIMYSAPPHLKKKNDERELKFWQSLLFFICLMLASDIIVSVFYLFIPSQTAATILQQLIFLFSSVIFVRLMHADPREVFPIRRPRAEGVLGVCILAVGAYLAADVISVWTYYLAPEQLMEISAGMEDLFTNPFLEILTIVVLPPICEEALHRGVILSGCRNSFHRFWVIVIADAVIFGIFHIYPVRWAAPMLIGGIMAWIVLRSDNMFYSSLLHALYNALILLASYVSDAAFGETADLSVSGLVSASAVGSVTIFYGVFVPVLIYTGGWLVRRTAEASPSAFVEKGMERTRLLQIFVPTFMILLVGILMLFL